MQSLKNSTTLSKALRYIGQAIGETNKIKQLRIANDIRSYLYAKQTQLGLDLSIASCVELQCFNNFCPTRCDKKFYGFRLPADYTTINAAYVNDRHIHVQSAYRTPHDGIINSSYNSCQTRIIDKGYSPFESDPSDCWDGLIEITPKGCLKDTEMVIEGHDLEGNQMKKIYKFEDQRERFKTKDHFSEIFNISFTNDTTCALDIHDCQGKKLATYTKGDCLPRYRTFEFIGYTCCGKREGLVIFTNRKYVELDNIHEIVEYDNVLVWKNFAKYFNESDNLGADGNNRANKRDYLAEALDLVISQQEVEDNQATETIFRRKRLKSVRRINQGRTRRSRRRIR